MPKGLSPDDYQPRILGTGQSSKVPVTELVIVGKDQLEALRKLLDAFKEHGVELLGLESQSMPQTKLFVITAFTN
ncbi:MAG: peroxiredoxin family protein, partial [Thaumarchaeota archaeon]|nr:peroxiredoxin family protein [Nitrososphaerota archaeon]